MHGAFILSLVFVVLTSWPVEVASKRNSYRIDRIVAHLLDPCRDGSVCGFREAWNSCLGDDSADGCEFHLQTDVELDDVLHFSQLSQIPAIDGDLGSKEIHIRGRNTVVRHSSGHPRHSVSSSSTPRFMSLHGSRKHRLSLILEDLTIEGFGHEDIDGGAMSLSGLAAVHVANVQFRNSVGRHGGGLRIADVGHMVIANASFDNIVATGSGGAVFLDISHTNRVELSSLTARDCEADRGSLVHIQPSSVETDCVTSACSSETEIFLSDVHVEYATRTSIVHVDNGFSGQQFTMYIVGTKVVAQPSSDLLGATDGVERDHAGVALFDLGARMSALMLHDVVFELEEHHVIDDRPISAVAIQHTSKVQLSHVVVTASAQSNVSGIVATNVTSLDVASSTFTGLSASFGPAIAVHNVSQVTIANSSFTHNIATGDTTEFRGGGAVYAESFDSFVCSSSGFESNQAPNGFGGALMVRYGTSVGLDRNHYYFNTAWLDGGSVYVSHINTTVTLFRNIFFQGESESLSLQTSRGGGLFVSDIHAAEIIESQFLENSASFDGGAMYITNAVTLTITDTSFESNTAGGSGGGLAARSITELVSLVNSSFISNAGNDSSAHGGGLLLANIEEVDATGLTINGNTVGRNGGGVYCHQVTVSHWRSIQAAENRAGKHGGAMYAQWGTSLVTYQFNATHNKAMGGSGGAMATYYFTYTTLQYLTLFNNEASEWGGGIIQSSVEGTYILHSRIVRNTAGSSGGGVRFTHPSGFGLYHIHTSEIIGNIAYGSSSGGNGGGVSVSSVNFMELDTVKLQNNEARASYGGAMAVEGCVSLYVWSTDVIDNTAASNGGGFMLKNTGTQTLNTILFDGNRATSGDGGAVYNLFDEGYSTLATWAFIRAVGNVAEGDGGGIYITNVNTFDALNWLVMGNVASTGDGGGVYMTKISYQTTLKELNVTGNSAVKGHGGGIAFVSSPLASNDWQRNYIRANVAGRSGGGLYLQKLKFAYFFQVTLVGNQGTDYGGGMFIDELVTFLVDEMTVRANVASMGGGMHVESMRGSHVHDWAFDNVFDGNQAEAGGAMSFGRTNRFYTVNAFYDGRMLLYNNQANYGSVLYAVEYGLHNRSIYQSEVINNTALGGGTFFFLLHTDVVSNLTQREEPLTIDTYSTTIKGNIARFGTLVASQMIAFEGPSVYHAVPNGNDFATPIVFSAFQDFFNQTFPDDSFRLASPISSYECSGVVPAISTTGSDGAYRQGVVSFQRTSMSCARGGFVNVQFTVAYDLNIVPAALSRNEPTLVSSGVHTAKKMTQMLYRNCLRGERVVGTRCTPCVGGEYSFRNDSEVCESCTFLKGVRSCRQQHLDLKPGYWRYDEDTLAVIPCWTRGACTGGEASGASLCRTGYEGPACGVCSAGYFSNGRKCKRCDGRSELTGGILLLIALTVSITALLALYLYRQKIRIQTLSAILVYVRQSYPKIISKVKVILATFQIVANIPVTLQIQLPLIFMRYLTTLEVFNLNFGVMFPFACAISLDYMQFLLLVTLLPIGLSVALLVGFLVERYGLRLLFPIRYYRAKYVGNNGSVVAAPAVDAKKCTSLSSADPNHSTIPPAPTIAPPRTVEEVIASYQHEQEEHRRIRTRYLNMWFYLTYLVLPAATTAVFQVFNCTDIDPYKENPELSSSRFMTADMRISCDSAYYLSWIPYTIAMVVVYPIGIPLTYFLVLYAHREEISTRDVVADEEREVWLYQQLFSKPTPTPMKAAYSSVAAAVEANDSDDGIDNTRQEKELAGYSGSDSVVTKSLSPEGDVEAALCALTDDPETSTPAPLSEDSSHTEDDPDLVYLQSLPPSLHPPHEYTGIGQDNHGNENVGETLLTGYATNLSPEVTGLDFLWSAYEPRFWYWEVIETIRRVILTAVIAIISPGTSLQSILAILFAIFFLQLYGVFAPYEDEEDDTLANIGQIQVFLTFFAALIVQNQLVSETWFNLLGILMIVINVVMYAMPFVFLARRLESMARIYRRQQELMSKMDAMGLDKDVDEDNNSDSGSGGGVVGGLSKGVVSAHEYAGPQEASDPSSNPNHDAIGEVTSTVREQDVEEKAADSGDHRNPPVPPLHTPSTASLSRSHSARPTTGVAPPKKRTQLHRYRSEMSLRLAMEMERTSTYHAHHKQRYRHHPDEPSPQFPWSPAAMRAFHAMQSLVSESPMKPVDPGTTPLSRQSSVRRPPAPPTRQWSTDSLPPSTAAAAPAAASSSASAHAVPVRGVPRSQSASSSS